MRKAFLILTIAAAGCSAARPSLATMTCPTTTFAVREMPNSILDVTGMAWGGGSLRFPKPITLVERRCDDVNTDVCVYHDGQLIVHLLRANVVVYDRVLGAKPSPSIEPMDDAEARPEPRSPGDVPASRI